jgi:hypothetical protein
VPTHEIVEPVTVRALRELVLPTAPDKITGAVLPALRVRDWLPDKVPLTVPPKEIPVAPVVVIIVLPDRTVGTALVTVNDAALTVEVARVRVFVIPAAEDTVTAPRATAPPTASLKRTPPTVPESRVRDCPLIEVPLTVPPKYIPVGSERPAIIPRVVIVVFVDRTVGTALVTLNDSALIEEDPRVRVFVVPEAEITCIAPSGIAEVPTSPNKLIFPSVPASRVREYAPLTVPPKEIPAAPVVVIVVSADRTVGAALPTVNEAALIAVAADPRVSCDAAEIVNVPRGCTLPTRPLKLTELLHPLIVRL